MEGGPNEEEAPSWEAHFDQKLSFLPSKEAVLTDLIKEEVKERGEDFYKKVDGGVARRFMECEHKTDMQRLNLSSLRLKVIPIRQAIFNRLKVLSLRGNCLTELPTEAFTSLYQLETLIVSHNQVAHIPDTISALVSLRRLVASHNRLSGSLPAGLFLCHQLREVDVSHNALTHLPPDVRSLPRLHRLLLAHNSLVTLPAELCDMPLLEDLDLRGNPLDAKALPDALLLKSSAYGLARDKQQRQKVVHRANAVRAKLLDAYKKSLISQTDTFGI